MNEDKEYLRGAYATLDLMLKEIESKNGTFTLKYLLALFIGFTLGLAVVLLILYIKTLENNLNKKNENVHVR
jgi:L-cystine uptake protein TcyP (sodium:dicarboxylate symporter family)